jgi:hypothetical protein
MSELLIRSVSEDVDLYLELFSNICSRVVCGYNNTSYKIICITKFKRNIYIF